MMRLGRRASLLLAFCALAACATANTPQQDRTWAAYNACKGRIPANITIDRVEPDGRYYWQTREGSFGQSQLENCMREEFAKTKRP
jgi:hypothetical protein